MQKIKLTQALKMTKNKFQYKKEAMLCIIVLLFALVIFAASKLYYANKKPVSQVEVYVQGSLYKVLDIIEGNTFDIVQNDRKNTLVFTKNGVKMLHSNCDNQLCLEQGEVNFDNYANRVLGTDIICLPNAVVLRLKLQNASNAPDF